MSTTMHFGPEWMRTKHSSSSRPNPHPSPPPNNPATSNNNPAAATTANAIPPNTPTQSTQNSSSQLEKRDNPPPLIRYSKEELLRIYRQNGGKEGVGVDSDRWDSAAAPDPSTEAQPHESNGDEKKRYGGPLARRQSSDFLSSSTQSTERPRLTTSPSVGSNSPLRDRFGGLMSARRRDSSDQNPSIPRKLSLSNSQGSLGSRDVGLPSPRSNRIGSSNFDGVLSSGDSWVSRRRASEAMRAGGGGAGTGGSGAAPRGDSGGDEHRDGGPVPSVKEDVLDKGAPLTRLEDKDRKGVTQAAAAPTPPPQSAVSSASSSSFASNDMSTSMSKLSVTDPTHAGIPTNPVILDYAAVEWSYLDPQGQVQGPFRADLMQKWHDDGYFTHDLLMKRLHIDKDWMTVAQITQRTASPQIFLTPIGPPPPPPGPPGLTRLATESPSQLYSSSNDVLHNNHLTSSSDGPHQPAPLRSLRASALESFVGNGSSASDSPSSSFGAARSQEPSAFGGRAGNAFLAEQQMHIPATGAAAYDTDPFSARRALYADNLASGSTDLAANVPRVDGYGYGNAYSPATSSPWLSNVYNGVSGEARYASAEPNSSYLNGHGVRGFGAAGQYHHQAEPANTASAGAEFGFGSPASQRDSFVAYDSAAGGTSYPNQAAVTNAYNQFLPQQPQQQQQQGHPYQNAFGATNASKTSLDRGDNSPMLAHTTTAAWPSTPEQTSGIRRPGPFDAQHPTSRNTVPQAQAAPTPWSLHHNNNAPQQVQEEPSPWFSNAQTTPAIPAAAAPTNWSTATTTTATDSSQGTPLTVSNVSKHNQRPQQQQVVSPVAESPRETFPPASSSLLTQRQPEPEVVEQEPAPAVAATSVPTTAPANATTTTTPAPKTRKSTSQLHKSTPTASTPTQAKAVTSSSPPPSQPTASSTATPTTAKPAWSSTENDGKKSKGLNASLSLREIQEAEAKKAEAKKAEARKAAEREREKAAARLAAAAAAASSSSSEESHTPFTATWGLSGARGTAAKDSSSSSALLGGGNGAGTTSNPVTVWSAAKPAAAQKKKTMKEIQEEEEKRKAQAVAAGKSVAAAAAAATAGSGGGAAAAVKRALVEGTSKSPQLPSANTAWTTVGVGGKVGTPGAVASSPVPSRPTVATSASSATIPTSVSAPRVNGVPASSNAHRPPVTPAGGKAASNVGSAASRLASSAAVQDEQPVAPSHDFVRWLSDSLKGLNSSVNVEEIMSMLLTFPVDADSSTLEIISDLIYANSTTLDGRRFASEFASKRKVDAATPRSKLTNGSNASSSKVVSIADVVKAQPKPAQPEWGGFKVVNKKKKGSRA